MRIVKIDETRYRKANLLERCADFLTENSVKIGVGLLIIMSVAFFGFLLFY